MPLPADPEGLSVIGLGPAEQAAYELLIDQPAATLAELAAAWSRSEPLPAVLAALEDRALLTSSPGPPVRYSPVAPDIAFGGLLGDYEEQIDNARRYVGVLDTAYQARPAEHQTSTIIEVVTGQRAIRQRLRQIQRGARNQIGCLARPPYFDSQGTTDAALDLLRRGLGCRTIYDRSAIEHPGALATVESLIRAGQQSRVLPELPLSLYLIDARIAVLPLRHEPSREGRQQWRQPGRERGREPGRQPGRQPGREPGCEPGRQPGREPGREPGRQPGREPGREPGRQPGREPGREPSSAEAAVIVHPSALLDALVKLFDGLWLRAVPLHLPHGAADPRPDADQQRLVTLLLSGLTDEAIARQLGVSHRTVQRRVAAFMADFGAHTRFQAGAKAALQQRRRLNQSPQPEASRQR